MEVDVSHEVSDLFNNDIKKKFSNYNKNDMMDRSYSDSDNDAEQFMEISEFGSNN